MELGYLFCDMNAYFASVEQNDHPRLRGQPVAVVPTLADTTCCIAVSYEAKRMGVRTGTLVADAKLLCPRIQILEARPRRYIEVHHQILSAIDTVLPVEAVLSIDEVVCRLLGREREPAQAAELGRRVKAAIRERAGEALRCSVGIGPNRLIAKVASDMRKPDGLTLIRRSDLPHALYGLRLTDLPGVGTAMEARLFRHGVTTVEELYRLTVPQLSQVWGSRIHGFGWWHRLRGEDLPEAPTQRRSLSHSHVLPPAFRTEEGARAVLSRLTQRAGLRLRKEGYWAGSLGLFVRFLDDRVRRGWDRQLRIRPCQDTLTLLEVAQALWAERPEGTPFKLGVALGGLIPDAQISWPLFEADQARTRLSRAMDEAVRRYGSRAVYFAGMARTEGSAVTRIAFNRIPDLELPEV